MGAPDSQLDNDMIDLVQDFNFGSLKTRQKSAHVIFIS